MSENESLEHGRSFVMRAAGLVAVFLLLGRVLGLVREIIIQGALGTESVAANAYAVANQFPETIFFVIAGGAMSSAFIPTFTDYLAREDEAGAWRLFSGVISLLLVVVTAVSIVVAVFAPQFVHFFYAQKIAAQPAILPETVLLIRIMLLSTTIFGISGVVMSALQSKQHFLYPALAPILYGVGIILFGLLIKPPQLGFSIGAVVGALAHLLVQLPALRRHGGRYFPVLSLRDPGIRKVLRLMGPRVLGLSFSRLNQFVIVFLIGRYSAFATGAFVAQGAAFRVTLMPQGIIGQALGQAAFPTLSSLASRGEYGKMREILTDTMRILFFLGLPVTILLMMLRIPVITILFERGLFDAESTRLAANALLFYAIGMIAITALEVVNRAFFALSDTWTPVLAGAIQIGAMALLSGWFSLRVFPNAGQRALGGLAFGFSISNIIEVVVLWLLLRRKLGHLDTRRLLTGMAQMSVAGVAMALSIWGVLRLLPWPNVWIELVVATAVGGLAYLTVSLLLRITELKRLEALLGWANRP